MAFGRGVRRQKNKTAGASPAVFRFCLSGGKTGRRAEEVALKIGVGDFADEDTFADEHFRFYREIFRARGHDDTDVRNHV